MDSLTPEERAITEATSKAIEVIIGLKKFCFHPVLSVKDEDNLERVRGLLLYFAFQNTEMPSNIPENIVYEQAQHVLTALSSSNLMLPVALQRQSAPSFGMPSPNSEGGKAPVFARLVGHLHHENAQSIDEHAYVEGFIAGKSWARAQMVKVSLIIIGLVGCTLLISKF